MLTGITILTSVLFLLTIAPTFNSSYWLWRSQINLRIPYLILSILLLTLVVFLLPYGWIQLLLLAVNICVIRVCYKSIAAFMPWANVTIATADKDSKHLIRCIVHNVYQDNTDYQSTVELISSSDADVVLLLETNIEWGKRLEVLREAYPYVIKELRENTYGLIMMSKYKYEHAEIKHRIKNHVPSIHATIKMDEQLIHIIGVHPEPPIAGHATSAKPKDLELLSAAYSIENLPAFEKVILAGDLNDVAWSKTSKAFKRISGLRDPRQGRGFYATFPAWSPFRIPLDHVFCSPQFKLKNLKVMRNTGSDHLPIYFSLAW